MQNFESFTGNLSKNNANLDSIILNLKAATQGLAQVDMKGTMLKLQGTTDSLNAMIAQAKSSNSSIGALLNSRDFYNNLNHTINSLHILMDDLRAHPKRYVGISIFGKKDKGN